MLFVYFALSFDSYIDFAFFKPQTMYAVVLNAFNLNFTCSSVGRRECPGSHLAKMELFLFFTNLIQRFEFKFPADQSEVSLEGRPGVNMMPHPFKICAVER